MNLKDFLTRPRYGIYLPKAQTTTDVEYTGYGSSFRLSTSLELGKDSFDKVKTTLDEFLEKSNAYFEENDMALLGMLLNSAAKGATYLIDFSKDGITLARLITVNAKKISFIYEKYNRLDYAIQLALTRESSIQFAWSDSKLTGDFYFNLKRSGKEDVTTITGYTHFHLGNEKGAKPVVLSAGIVNRLPVKAKSADKPHSETDPKPQKVRHTYVRLQSRSSKGITIADIVGMITPNAKKEDIPDFLDKIEIYDFAILTKNDKAAAATELAIVLDCKITISDKALNTKLSIISKKEKEKEPDITFHGVVSVEEHRFDINFEKQGDNWSLLASYANRKTVTIDFKKLAASLFGASDHFPDLKLDVAKPKVFFYYQKTKGESKGKLLIGMGAGIELNLQSLPIAGSVLEELKAFQFNEVIAIYANGEFNKTDLEPLTKIGLLPKTENIAVPKGVSVSAEVVILGNSTYYTLGGSASSTQTPSVSEPTPPLPDSVASNKASKDPQNITKSVASSASWFLIDKKLGPVNLQQLGLAYHEGKIIVLLDASIDAKGMTMQLMGIGIGFKMDWSNLDPEFYLSGLGLSYKTDAVEISGAFLRGNGGIDTYNGAARLKMKGFTISAIGSYAKTQEGRSSLFIYGVFEGNLGGPPEFFVTGIAAGFGYNRKVNAPELMDIADYPLVALAMMPADKGILDVLKDLEKPMSNGKLPIEISPDNYWLALGVKFTTYKLIESFVLITINFGLKTEFTVLGLSRLDWPEKTLRDKVSLTDPIIFVELAIRVSFGLDSDVIKVEGMITPNSYVLSKGCKLTGGFALYTWISGEHAGDFVLTIGGYHPKFQKPAHYPTVSSVGLNWQMDKYVLLKGELYFALTSSAIMMGGKWELIVNTPIVKVAFLLCIDLLLQWAPFYYDVSILVFLKIEAHIPLKRITIHLNLEISAQLQIWGPPFSGFAAIDLGIYSFEIQFGNKGLPDKNPLEWHDFAKGFLPNETPNPKSSSQKQRSRVLRAAPSTVALDCITATVRAGVLNIIEKQGEAEKIYIANPMQMEIAIDSTIPVTKLVFNEVATEHKNDVASLARLGVKPCGYKGSELDFEMTISMTLGDNEMNSSCFTTQKITKGFPEALWGVASDTVDKNPKTPELLSGIMSGMSIKTKTPEAHGLLPFDFSLFLEPYEHRKNEVGLSTLEKAEDFATKDVYCKMTSYQDKATTRNGIIDALKDLDIGFGTEDEFEKLTSVENIYQEGLVFFRATPKLCKIGYKTANPKDTI